eukprot:IDg14517t1
MNSAAFAAPVPLRVHRAPCALSLTVASRRVAPRASGDDGGELRRLDEWASFDGDRKLQDSLVLELSRATRRAHSSQEMDQRIEHGMAGVSDHLTELYLRSARELEEQHADLARRAALPQLSKWNQFLIQNSKMSSRARATISEELAEVQTLLKRSQRNNPRPRAPSQQAKKPSQFQNAIMTAGVTALMLSTFEGVAARENGPVQLAQFGSVSLLLCLLGIHLHNSQNEA